MKKREKKRRPHEPIIKKNKQRCLKCGKCGHKSGNGECPENKEKT